MSTLTTHVLDTARGRPAAGVVVVVERGDGSEVARGTTDADGRIADFLDAALATGVYRLRFETGVYFRSLGVRGFYPEVVVTVQLDEAGGHYHVPLLLSPYGYSTYRGS